MNNVSKKDTKIKKLIDKLNRILNYIESAEFVYNDTAISDQDHTCDLDYNRDDIIATLKDLKEDYDFRTYTLRYEDEDANPLSNFLDFSVYDLNFFIKENVAPYAAKYIGVYNNDGERLGCVNLGNLSTNNSPKRSYRVGLLSDVHFNEYNIHNDQNIDIDFADDGTEYYTDTKNALRYFTGKSGLDHKVDMIAVAGDLSTNTIDHIRNLFLIIRNYASSIPFFSCYGNHDYCAVTQYDDLVPDNGYGLYEGEDGISRVRHWNHVMYDENEKKYKDDIFDIEHCSENPDDLAYSTVCFKRWVNKEKNLYDVYIMLSVDYDRPNNTTASLKLAYNENNESQNDINELYKFTYAKVYPGKNPKDRTVDESRYDYQFYDCKTLLWFANKMEQYKNNRVFVFTHQFFVHKAGTNNSGSGYMYNAADNRINSVNAYCLSGIQFELLNYLNNKYSKSIWFTGHSHYKWEWQKFDSAINISNTEYDYIKVAEERQMPNGKYNSSLVYRIPTTTDLHDYYENWSDSFFEPGSSLKAYIDVEKDKKYNFTVYANAGVAHMTPILNVREVVAKLRVVDNDNIVRQFDIPVMSGSSMPDINEFKFDLVPSSNSLCFEIYVEKTGTNWLTIDISDFKVTQYENAKGTTTFGEPSSAVLKKHDSIKNVLNANTAYNVHIPSTARPIPLGKSGYGISGLDSQGAIMDVYEDYVDIRGIIFKDYEIKNVSNDMSLVAITSDVCHSDDITIVQDDNSILFTIHQPGDSVHIDLIELENSVIDESSGTLQYDTTSNKEIYLNVNLEYIKDKNGNDVSIDSLVGSGFVTHYNDWTGSYMHTLENHCYISFFEKMNILFEMNDGLVNYPITIKMSPTIQMLHLTNYINKYLPLAQYRIPVSCK